MYIYRLGCVKLLMILFLQLTVFINVTASEQLRIGGSGADLATMRLLTTAFAKHHEGLQVVIPPSLGSRGGLQALMSGALDLALISRKLKEDEIQANIKFFQYARTPLVFATSKSTLSNNITSNEVNNIYSGAHPYWPDGNVARPVLRLRGDSDTLLLKKYVPGFSNTIEKALKRRGVPVASSDQDNVQRIESIPGAIGTSTLSVILSENRNLKALAFNGVVPSVESITSGQYIMAKEMYFVLPEKVLPVVTDFLKFLQSSEARIIFEQTGHQVIQFNFTGQ